MTMCILCDNPLKTLRKITWQKKVCGNKKCDYYNVGSPPDILGYTLFTEGKIIYRQGKENLFK